MQLTRTKKIVIGAGLAALVGGGIAGGVAAAGVADDHEQPITGDALTTATRVALEHTGGGTVTETEVGDEDSYYEVEVTLPNGAQVDVQLDEDFDVVASEVDDESEAEGQLDD